MKYKIESKEGGMFGVYDGSSAAEAWAAMVADGGEGTDAEGYPTEGTLEDWIITVDE